MGMVTCDLPQQACAFFPRPTAVHIGTAVLLEHCSTLHNAASDPTLLFTRPLSSAHRPSACGRTRTCVCVCWARVGAVPCSPHTLPAHPTIPALAVVRQHPWPIVRSARGEGEGRGTLHAGGARTLTPTPTHTPARTPPCCASCRTLRSHSRPTQSRPSPRPPTRSRPPPGWHRCGTDGTDERASATTFCTHMHVHTHSHVHAHARTFAANAAQLAPCSAITRDLCTRAGGQGRARAWGVRGGGRCTWRVAHALHRPPAARAHALASSPRFLSPHTHTLTSSPACASPRPAPGSRA